MARPENVDSGTVRDADGREYSVPEDRIHDQRHRDLGAGRQLSLVADQGRPLMPGISRVEPAQPGRRHANTT